MACNTLKLWGNGAETGAVENTAPGLAGRKEVAAITATWKGLGIALLLTVGLADVAEAAESAAASRAYGDRSDEELTALAASWDSLNKHQRRALLTEMKLRMARNSGRSGVIRIRTERRYGRIIRQPDGRVIHIETQVVHVRPIDAEELAAERLGFGLGFEHRVAQRRAVAPADRGETGDEATDAILGNVLQALEPAPPDVQEPLPILRVTDPAP